MRAPPEPTVPLAQARARWGDDVVVAGLFRPGPDPEARTALTKAVTRRSNRRRSELPARILVAIDDAGRALICPVAADSQGGHPAGDDLYEGPFEVLGAVPAGPLSIVVLLEADRPVVLEAVWLDHDAATVAALLTGEPVPDNPDPPDDRPGDDGDDEAPPSPEELLVEADEAQAWADSLRARAAAQIAAAPADGPAPMPPGQGTGDAPKAPQAGSPSDGDSSPPTPPT